MEKNQKKPLREGKLNSMPITTFRKLQVAPHKNHFYYPLTVLVLMAIDLITMSK